MQIITTAAAIDAVADTDLRAILERYVDMIDLATIYIIESGDSAGTLAAARGWPCEGWEFIIDHGGWLEGVFVLSQDGAGHVVLVPDRADTDSDLLALFKAHAVQADD